MSFTVQASKEDLAASNGNNAETTPKLPDDDQLGTAGDVELSADRLSKLRLGIILFSLALALFLSSLETSIVATALVSVSANLGYFGSANWIVVSYFLTYTGFMIVYARLSDVYGRKALILLAVTLFGFFSLGCGLARDMTSLIILRAFQGMGGSGIYAMVFPVALEVVPLEYFGTFSGVIMAVYASSSILGPLLGGAISSTVSWRWIFLLNIPPCGLILVLLFLAYPKNAPRTTEVRSLKQVDGLGLFLGLAASVLLAFPLEEAGDAFPWRSGPIVGTFVASGVCWVLFVAWLIYLPKFESFAGLPAFPLRLLGQRVLAASYLTGFLVGGPFTATLILLPQRYQIVNALSPLQAGIRMLPLLLSSAFGSTMGGLSQRFQHGMYASLILGQSLVIIGFGLLSTINTEAVIPAEEYGFLVILGIGFGCGLSTVLVLSRAEVSPQDSAILMASLTQTRVLGGCIGLAVANALVTSQTSSVSALVATTTSNGGSGSIGLISSLPGVLQSQVRESFAQAFVLETRVMLGIASLAWLSSLFTWNPRARSMEEVKAEQAAWEREIMRARQNRSAE